MKTICLYFEIHQVIHLKRYRFFDIGTDHYYYDSFENERTIAEIAEKSYMPALDALLQMIRESGQTFKVTFSLSGVGIEQLEIHAPQVLEKLQELNSTGCVEFLAEPYSHGLASLANEESFKEEVKRQAKKIKEYFSQTPKVLRNSSLIYSDEIGLLASQMGFKGMLTEGAKHILGWRSPNFVYHNPQVPRLKLLLKNFQLSDDIAFRFSNRGWSGWPLTAEKYVHWLTALPGDSQVVNLFMDYETFGEHQWAETGIFEFMRALPGAIFQSSSFNFLMPKEVAAQYQSVGPLHVTHPISWADEERDLTAWLGNELQNEAFSNVYALSERVCALGNDDLTRTWMYLQTSDHFYYMCTKWFSDGDVHKYFNPYDSPYEAFVNYMNVLSDFLLELKKAESRI